ncbi:MAG TPA: hypothetical protein VKJ45_12525 [Blastocatellia bacterium]|nr:hypothetical protein [Blastocatellia bacterium]
MGGIIQLANLASLDQAQMPQVPTTGASTAVTNPTSPFDDLQNRADAIRQQQVMQDLQNRAAAISPPPQPGQISPDNPFASLVADYSARVKQSAPDSTPKDGVKGFLSNFFQGAGDAMLTQCWTAHSLPAAATGSAEFRAHQHAREWLGSAEAGTGLSASVAWAAQGQQKVPITVSASSVAA